MRRIACDERADWRDNAEQTGFDFHTIDGERYWDERAYYAFTLEQIERDIEAPTAELDDMCRELVERAIADERMMKRPADSAGVLELDRGELASAAIRASTAGSTCATTARVRPSCSNTMPTRRPRCSRPRVFQWKWLEDAIARKRRCRAMPTNSIRCTSG